jgi:hypothetical protein
MNAPVLKVNAGATYENRYLKENLTLPEITPISQVGKLFMTTIRYLHNIYLPALSEPDKYSTECKMCQDPKKVALVGM